jgi:hypothetical protein
VGVVVGVAAAVLIVAVRRLAADVDRMGGRRLGMPALLVAGGLAVGVLAELADVLGADSQDVLFSGQTSVPGLVTEGSTKVVLILVAAKALGYAVSLGWLPRRAGVPGGVPRGSPWPHSPSISWTSRPPWLWPLAPPPAWRP